MGPYHATSCHWVLLAKEMDKYTQTETHMHANFQRNQVSQPSATVNLVYILGIAMHILYASTPIAITVLVATLDGNHVKICILTT